MTPPLAWLIDTIVASELMRPSPAAAVSAWIADSAAARACDSSAGRLTLTRKSAGFSTLYYLNGRSQFTVSAAKRHRPKRCQTLN